MEHSVSLQARNCAKNLATWTEGYKTLKNKRQLLWWEMKSGIIFKCFEAGQKKKTNKKTNRKNINNNNKKLVVISNGIWGPCKIISWLSIESDDQTKHLQISLFINTSELYITVVHLKSARFSTTNSIYRWLGNWTRSQA